MSSHKKQALLHKISTSRTLANHKLTVTSHFLKKTSLFHEKKREWGVTVGSCSLSNAHL